MGRKLVAWTLCAFVASMVAGPLAHAGDPTLIGWWKLDDGAGTVVADSSGYGNDGTVVNPAGGLGTGGSVWVNDPERGMVIGFNGTDGSGACVTTTLTVPMMTLENDFTWVFWAKQHTDQATNNDTMLGNRYGGTATPQFIKFTPTRFECYNNDSSYINGINYTSIPTNVWIHHVVVKDGASLTYYRDGVVMLTNTMTLTVDPNPFYMGADGYSGVQEAWEGYLSDVRLYERALSVKEIQNAMAGKGPNTELAGDPVPEDGATDVPRDVVLGWSPGEYAATHDVYFDEDCEYVNNATQPIDTVSVTAYDPDGLLEYGRTYCWRVDEVNGTPDHTAFKGEVWRFTTEPYAYPITNLTAKASSQQTASPATRTIDGSGLDEFDQHGTDLKTMWVTPGGLPAWIQYTFDKAYTVHELWVWNANSELESLMGFGASSVTIEYSTDGETWNQLENVPEFARGTGTATYTANTKVDFGEVVAKYVKLTINDNWGATTMVSLSEVRFFYTPVQAFAPTPADGATGVDIDATFNWRPGRKATSHEVYFGTDANAVAEGTVTAETVADHRFTPASVDFGTKYYWRVDEVGDAGTDAGDVWSFTAQEFEPVDDFESYDDVIETETTIWHAWIDGLTTEASGSQIGYTDAPFAERAIVHGGKQSMPFTYDNATKFFFSEASREFDTPQNWTGNGATDVGLWTRGYPAMATVEVTETGGKMNVTGDGADIWNNSDEFTYAYKTLAGDGTLIARVVSNGTGTNAWAKGGVMIRDGLNGGSTHAMTVITAHTTAAAAGNGASFQYRATTDGASANADSATVVAPPYWVRIQRFGDTFTGSVSADGTTWTTMGTTTITMADPVYIGICVTSHAAGEDRTFQFDGIAATGAVTGAWQGAVIDSPKFNGAADMYLTIQDSAGKSATVVSDTAVTVPDWTLWKTPMSDFAGVNFAKVKKMTIVIGDKSATAAGATGIVFIDDIGFGRAAE